MGRHSKIEREPKLHTSTRGVKVCSVERGSVGEFIGIQPGDRLVALNGHPVEDILDYWYYASASRLTIDWWDEKKQCIRRRTVRITPQERLGLDLEPFEIRRCNNACVFCFVHQLPRGLRRELYVKDEDYRLSFLYGNYITGTSLNNSDVERIIKMRLSPLYFSVHATDEQVRRKLLANPFAPPIVPLLEELVAKGIVVHTQVVLCPGWNDGAVLEKTVEDLSHLYPGVRSVAVVPVGLTDYRQNLPQLQPVTQTYAVSFISYCENLQRVFEKKIGFPLVFPSDEFYLIAGLSPPTYDAHEEIPQLENGVGMVSSFYRGCNELLKEIPRDLPQKRRVLAITSPLGHKVIERLVGLLNSSVKNLILATVVQTNTLFGPGITVTGLLPGRDFASAIAQHPNFDSYLIPENALRPWDNRFLDDMTLPELQALADGKVRVGGSTAREFVRALFDD
ncbi:MAG: DUF512 domain-containing protein [Candidatus Sumerlaeaceae bacterium]|nr:DUF512 domain-containing protein [Candidatus Sumerlaeaceae bacterium]